MKLLAVMLGGTAPGANTELHDTVFAVGETIESTYEQLMGQWFGSLRGVHIDSWLPLEVVDGHRVLLRADAPAPGDPKLWFVNLGAYRHGRFGELHEVAFLVAATADQVKARARAALLADEHEPHTDDLHEIDDILQVTGGAGLHVHLVPVVGAAPPPLPAPVNGWHPLPEGVIAAYALKSGRV
jgi:hypothetical protein